uniref:Bromodomain associated domain-containing protein n=1 Tax=Salix viminalis TaxID=40686 RepID=A0A6N2LR07_SALVM
MSVLGDDGLGYDLARKLETLGMWRAWLGDSLYSNFLHFLSSPASWNSFMRTDDSKSKSHIQLQLRARALLFDKASVSLFLRSNTVAAVSKLNPNYLQLHGDDVYFTLEDEDQRREGSGVGAATKRYKNEELPETWYNQFMEKRKLKRPYRLSYGDRESDKRSPEQMSSYSRLVARHKRRCHYLGPGNSNLESTSNMRSCSVLDGSHSVDDDFVFFPETMFMFNCVPDSAIPPIIRARDNQKIEFRGAFDSLPQTRNPVMIERLGITVEQGGSLHRGKNGSEGHKKLLSEEQASQMSQKVVACLLTRVGFDGASEIPVEVFSQLLRCHISKLGRILRVLADSYRKQCSPVELLKMFLQTPGLGGNLVNLMEIVKEGARNTAEPTHQQVHGIQSQFHSQHQNLLRLPQQLQIPRQMHPQMQPMVHPQNFTFQQQQQLERMRRRQPSTPRPGMDMDKDKPLVQVKVENPPESPLDNNAFNAFHPRQPQMQFRQQHIAAMSNLHAQSTNQLRQLASLQVPQMQTSNMGMVRAPPVKVEGFQELMGGDAALKHDTEENKLTSPSSYIIIFGFCGHPHIPWLGSTWQSQTISPIKF